MTRLLTTQGYRAVVHERGWPLAGLDLNPGPYDLGSVTLPLVDLPGGEQLRSTYEEFRRHNVWVYACQELIARGFSRLPVHVFVMDDKGERTRVRPTTHVGAPSGPERLAALMRRPNPRTSGQALRYATFVDKLTYGNALWYLERRAGAIVAIWHIPWKYVKVVAGQDQPIERFEVSPGWRTRVVLPDDAVHFGVGSDPTRPVGLSPLEPLAQSLALSNAIQRHLTAYFQNQARPSANVKLSPEANQEAIASAIAQVRRLYTAPENSGKVVVTTGDWQPITANPQHSEVINLAKFGREEVCAVYSVPPPLVGILDRAIMSNVRELIEWYARQTLGPHVSAFEDDVDAQLISQFPSMVDTFIEVNLYEQLRADPEARASAMKDLVSVFTPDELRRRENLPPLDIKGYSDTVWLPPGATRLGEPEPAPEPAPAGDGFGGAPARLPGSPPVPPAPPEEGEEEEPRARHASGKHDQTPHGNWASWSSSGRGHRDGGTSPAAERFHERLAEPDGGFTAHPATGVEPTRGYAVAGQYPDRETVIHADAITPGDLDTFHHRNRDLWVKDDHLQVGGWHDPESHLVYLDVATVVDTAEEAADIAARAGDIAYFDIAQGKSVTVGAHRIAEPVIAAPPSAA